MSVLNSPTERFGRFQLFSPLGNGPNGLVTRASTRNDAGGETWVAVKRFLPELTAIPSAAEALSAAAGAYGSLDHPRVARMLEFGAVQGHTFTAVELVAGLDAKRLLVEAKLNSRGIAPGCALTLISHAARAVGYAHSRGVSHLGLAPTNLIITADGEVQVTDFGILAATMAGRPIDAPRLADRIAYVAPEQLQGEKVSLASDVFVLASITYELISGHRAFAGNHARAVSQAILAGPPAELSLPRPIENVLRRCFAPSPQDRFTDARAFADALDAALRTAPVAGTQRELAALAKAALGKNGTSTSANPSPAPAGGRQPLAVRATPAPAPQSTTSSLYVPIPITTPPPIPAPPVAANRPSQNGSAVVGDPTTMVGVPGAPRPRTPSRGNAEPGDRRLAIAIRPPAATPRGSSAIVAVSEHNGTSMLGQHPITSPPFQQEPTSQIPPELVQNLLNASLPDPLDRPHSPRRRRGSDAAISGLFELPDGDDGSAPLTPEPSPIAAVSSQAAQDLTDVDLEYLTPAVPSPRQSSKRRWLWGVVGLLSVAGLGVVLWSVRSPTGAPAKPAPTPKPPTIATAPAKPAPTPPTTKPTIASAPAKPAPTPPTPTIASAPAKPAPTPAVSAPQPAAPSAPSAPQPTALVVSSTPPGARVFIDGADQGVTPVKLPGSTDRHNIALLLAGHELYLGDAEGHGALDIPLKPVIPSSGPAGIKVIRCKDKGRYYVFVDGKPTGMTCPTERIECGLGPHTVEVYDVVTESRRKWDIVVTETRLSYRVRVD